MMDWNQRIRAATTRAGREPYDDVVEELAQHAGTMYASARADGASQDEAGRRVELQIALWADDASLLRRRSPPVSAAIAPPPAESSSRLAGLAQDLRYAVRLSTRQAGFTLLVVCTMALGIGAATLLFSITYGVQARIGKWNHHSAALLLRIQLAGERVTRAIKGCPCLRFCC